VFVHEKTGAKHETGKAKFLEDSLNQARSGYADRIRARTESNIKRGVEMPMSMCPDKPETGPDSAGPKRRKPKTGRSKGKRSGNSKGKRR
jgi:hypothetical protein